MRDKNLRPRDGKPFSDYSLNDRYRHMSEAADDIAEIAEEIAERRSRPALAPSPPSAETWPPWLQERRVIIAHVRAKDGSRASIEIPEPIVVRGGRAVPEIKDRDSLKSWLEGQSREVAIAIGVRAGLRMAPLVAQPMPIRPSAQKDSLFSNLASAVFRTSALARVATKYPTHADELRAATLAADAAALAAAAAFTAGAATFGAAAVAFATDIDTVALVTAAASTAAHAHAAVWIEIRLDASALQELGGASSFVKRMSLT